MVLKSPTVLKTVTITPHAEKITDALSRIGYKFEEAAADLLDNSLDAGASNVLFRFIHNQSSIKQIWVADDGYGMTASELLRAMQFGSERPREATELGKFGMGLKTAALSQGRSLTVISLRSGRVSACRWTVKSISAGWGCEVLSPEDAATWLARVPSPIAIQKSGTLIVIDDLDNLQTGGNGLEATLQRLHKRLSVHLGLVFHRFISRDLNLFIDAATEDGESSGFRVPITPLDPFDYAVSGDKNYPLDFNLHMEDLPVLKCRAHIWPPNQNTPAYHLGGGNVTKRQGFYFYRNGRLIQAGGWNGWRQSDNEHHLSLARVEIDLTASLDGEFRLNVQKSGLDVPESFRTAINSASHPLLQYIKRAEEVYRKTEAPQNFIPVPGRGFGGPIRRRASAFLAGRKSPRHEVNVVWQKLDENLFFQIDRNAGDIILNSRYRKDILNGSAASLNDAPLLKTLLFLLLRDDLLRERESKGFVARLEEINELAMLAIEEEQRRRW